MRGISFMMVYTAWLQLLQNTIYGLKHNTQTRQKTQQKNISYPLTNE